MIGERQKVGSSQYVYWQVVRDMSVRAPLRTLRQKLLIGISIRVKHAALLKVTL
jgi:hypothetical protein